jgi:hypothetical protein
MRSTPPTPASRKPSKDRPAGKLADITVCQGRDDGPEDEIPSAEIVYTIVGKVEFSGARTARADRALSALSR